MNNNHLFSDIQKGKRISKEEALKLWSNTDLPDLINLANEIKKDKHPENKVSWIIDRNVNITNICFSHCLFCNFCVKKNDPSSYVLSMDDYRLKINELFKIGGKQLLLQGGMNPELDLDYYVSLFKNLKSEFPELKLHAFGPPEIVWLSKQSGKTYSAVLESLIKAGLDSLPGAGAEILSERVRKIVSPGKASVNEWLDVMHEAHKLNLTTSATMMFGFLESAKERIEHLFHIRDLQDKKPENAKGFIAFIPWPYQRENTELIRKYPDTPRLYAAEYVKMIALSRILLPNIDNIQASWLTVGKDAAALSLNAGANDLGSIMIEEHVVSAAGANYKLNSGDMQKLIKDSGFTPVLRDQEYNYY